jgi:hypothetical protein
MNNNNGLMTAIKTQSGQAMTEMLVASAFVVIPLFLIIPTFGKFIDMKHAAVSSARYAAWERTVHFMDTASLSNQPSGFKGLSSGGLLPSKTNAQLASEAQLQIFSEATAPINGSSQVGRVFWTYYDGSPMYAPPSGKAPIEVVSNEDTPDETFGIARTAVEAVGTAVSFITGILPFSSSQFDAINMKGMTTKSVAMSVKETPRFLTIMGDDSGVRKPLIDVGNDYKMLAKAGVLSQTWSAGGGDHLKSQAQALAPTKLIGDVFNLIDIPVIGSGQNVIAIALATPELTDKNLVFGQMDVDALPRDKFSEWELSSPTTDTYIKANSLCNDKGYCRE